MRRRGLQAVRVQAQTFPTDQVVQPLVSPQWLHLGIALREQETH